MLQFYSTYFYKSLHIRTFTSIFLSHFFIICSKVRIYIGESISIVHFKCSLFQSTLYLVHYRMASHIYIYMPLNLSHYSLAIFDFCP